MESKISMQNDRSYSKAVKRLATLLQKQEKIEMAYTHNENLLVYAITETDFPESFRIKTISLWLDNSKNNKDWDTLIKKCLEEHYSELKIVKLLMVKIFYLFKIELRIVGIVFKCKFLYFSFTGDYS